MEMLKLIPMCISDALWMDRLFSDKDVRIFLPHLPAKACDFIQNMFKSEQTGLGELWAIKLDDTGIGFIAIYDIGDNPFVFYAMLPEFRGRGYMKKCLQKPQIRKHIGLHTYIYKENIASQHVLANTGIVNLELEENDG